MGRSNFCFTGNPPPYNQYVYVDFPIYTEGNEPYEHAAWCSNLGIMIHQKVVPNMEVIKKRWFHTGGDNVQVALANNIIQIGFADCEVYMAVIVMAHTDRYGNVYYPNLVVPHVDHTYQKLLKVLYEAGHTDLHTSGGGYTGHPITKEMIYA